ncbi:MAG TPA: lamin tail domain-containing protein, partial [Verrucomicrobiales bacterium]|nr:lamin tail domain-containing protein [Verrucomicrobiales bacterium]
GLSKTAANSGNFGSFAENINYVRFTAVMPDASGTISGTFNDAAAANNAAFNGLQIVTSGPVEPPPPPPPPPPPRTVPTVKWGDADSVLVFNEIHYHPVDEAAGAEWVELRSLQGVDVDISGWRLEGGIDFQFPAGTIAKGRKFILVAANPAHSSLAGLNALGPFTGQLDNGGEELRLINNSGRVMDRVAYSDRGEWPAGPDGSGATLSKHDEEFADSGPSNWTTSASMGGTPGAVNFLPGARYPGLRVLFNEISAAGDAPFRFELINPSTTALEMTGYQVNSSAGQTFPLPAQTLAPGAVAVFSPPAVSFAPASGDRLFLVSNNSADFEDAREVTGRLRGRSSTGRWAFPAASSFGVAANSFAVNHSVVINEIMYHPHPAQAGQERWIELFNRGASSVPLGGWQLGDGVSYSIPANTTLAAGAYLVIADNPASLAARYPGITIRGPFSGSLSSKGERIQLLDPNNNVADEVACFDGGRWPELADGGGSSLERRSPLGEGMSPENWAASDESSRGQWQTVSYTGSGATIGTDPTSWNEFVFGLLTEGSFLIDDISVKEVSQGNRELIQGGTFDAGAAAPVWRCLGTHRRATV